MIDLVRDRKLDVGFRLVHIGRAELVGPVQRLMEEEADICEICKERPKWNNNYFCIDCYAEAWGMMGYLNYMRGE